MVKQQWKKTTPFVGLCSEYLSHQKVVIDYLEQSNLS